MSPDTPRAAGTNLFLVGFMGSGKTAVSERLSGRFPGGAVDLDRVVERRAGRSIPEIFAERGEPAFRALELDALLDLAAAPARVVACGGGLWEWTAARTRMRRRGVVVWLDVPLTGLRRRIGTGRDRPRWVDADPIEFRAFFERRRAGYALADARVAADGPPDGVAEAVFRSFERFLIDSKREIEILGPEFG